MSELEQLLSRITPDFSGGDGAGVRVAVIDSGIDRDAAAIAGRVAGGLNIRQSPDGSTERRRSLGKGSAAPGTRVAEVIVSVAPAVELFSADVRGLRDEGPVERIIEALRWSLENNCRVINLALPSSAAVAVAAR